MGRKRLDELGHLQRRVMEILWEAGPATVHQVRDALPDDPAYTTVLSVLQKLERAGWVSHTRDGRTYVYAPARSREEEGASALATFVERVFRGDRKLAFQHLLDDGQLDDGDLADLRAMIDARREEETDG